MSRVRTDKIVDRAGTGAVELTQGATLPSSKTISGAGNLNLTGIITAATGSFSGNVSVGGTITYEDVTNVDSVGLITARSGIRVTGGYSKLTGVLETVSAGTTYMSGSDLVLELDVQNATTYTYTNVGGNIGIVSFKNLPADAQNGTTITLIHTQNSSTPSGIGNTTAATGIGTNCTIIPFVNGSAIAGISTAAKVGSATTVTLSTTASDDDFVSFFVHYNGGTNTDLTSYKVYVTNNGNFRFGTVGI